MTSNPIKEKGKYRNIESALLKAFQGLSLEPKLIPSGRIEAIRGGLSTFEFQHENEVDTAVLLKKFGDRTFLESRYKIDYALRGNIKGILPGRIVTMVSPIMKGRLKKRILSVNWKIPPPHKDAKKNIRKVKIRPPGPGEIWKESPYQRITDSLNQDVELNESLRNFLDKKGPLMSPSIISDRWGETIRIRTNFWVKSQEILPIYATHEYLGLMNHIARHIKEVRRIFGGITF
jgi:hypothetical protein